MKAFFIGIVLSCITGSTGLINTYVHIKNKSTLEYKIVNNGNVTIYVPIKYYWRKVKDSIVMEAIYKPDKNKKELDKDDNVFIPPSMKQLDKNASLKMYKILNENLNLHQCVFYFRIFYKNDSLLLGKNKDESSEVEFLDFERKNSILVCAKISAAGSL